MLGAILFTSNSNAQFYNGTHVGFGKNRVQYDYFEWKYYRYTQYETYFYTGGKELALYTAKVARKHIQDQEEFFEYELKDKIRDYEKKNTPAKDIITKARLQDVEN